MHLQPGILSIDIVSEGEGVVYISVSTNEIYGPINTGKSNPIHPIPFDFSIRWIENMDQRLLFPRQAYRPT